MGKHCDNLNHHLQKASYFTNLLSDPTVILDAQGYVIFKNYAFDDKLSNKHLSLISIEALGEILAETFAYPYGELHQANTTQLPPSGKITSNQEFELDAYLNLNFYEDLHAVIIKPLDSEELLQQVLNSIPARVFWKDINSHYLGCNKLFTDDLGVEDPKHIIGTCDNDYFPIEQASAFQADDKEVMSSGQPKINIEEPLTRGSGDCIWLQTNKVPIRNNDNKIVGVMGSYMDITEKKEHETRLEKQANTDTLTGLPNRNGLANFLQKLKAKEESSNGCLLFIDLNGFKQINDTLGHQIGDRLLKSVSNRINMRSSDEYFSARLGGDEFAVLIHGNKTDNKEAATEIAQSLNHMIALPYRINNHRITISASIGITLIDIANGSWDTAYHQADLAMYEAKAMGHHSCVIYEKSLSDKYNKIITLRRLINSAVKNNELSINLQPQFNAKHQLIGAELLLRWHSSELGPVSPYEFIPIAEESGAIIAIGNWVIKKAFTLLYQWQQDYPTLKLPALAINISAKQFEQHDFIQVFENLIKLYPINLKLLRIELTESILINDQESVISKIQSLHSKGLAIEIDDFGTGYSSLSYLSQLPIDKIKIDRSFINETIGNHRKTLVLEGLINIGKSLNMGVLAEGVETQEQMDFLFTRGCEEYQGYYFSKPITEEDFNKQYISNNGL